MLACNQEKIRPNWWDIEYRETVGQWGKRHAGTLRKCPVCKGTGWYTHGTLRQMFSCDCVYCSGFGYKEEVY
jgi:DnaJ-class molecular chaperone